MKKKIKLVLKTIAYLLCLLIIWRVVFATDKSVNREYAATPQALAAAADGGITVMTNDVVEEISKYGYFSAYAFRYTEQTGQVQVTVRYNNSTVEKLGPVSFELLEVDTSEKADKDAQYQFEGYVSQAPRAPIKSDITSKLFYCYERLVFDGTGKIDENTNIVIRITPTPDGEDEATVTVHYAEQKLEEYKFTSHEKELLGIKD